MSDHNVFERLKLLAARRAPIEFLKEVDGQEIYATEGIRAVITGAQEMEDCIRLDIDYSPFDTHNQSCESHNYFDKHHIPCLTAREAGCYEPLDHIYVDPGDGGIGFYFRLLDDEGGQFSLKLQEAYRTEQPGIGYNAWLEDVLLKVKKLGLTRFDDLKGTLALLGNGE